MAFKTFYILVEGNDDERLIREKIEPKLMRKYDHINIVQWANRRKDYLKKYITSIISMGADYIFLRDSDLSPCISERKEGTKNTYNFLKESKICIVVQEIEGWYLAGLNEIASEKIKIANYKNTTKITKEKFEKIIPTTFSSKIDFMIEILKYFSIETAKNKNASFKYFYEKHIENST